MAKHHLRIDFDGDKLTVTHRTTVDVGGHAVSISEPVKLQDADGFTKALAALVQSNAKEMESRATEAAISHVAALQGVKKKGVKQLAIGGSVGAVGNVKSKG